MPADPRSHSHTPQPQPQASQSTGQGEGRGDIDARERANRGEGGLLLGFAKLWAALPLGLARALGAAAGLLAFAASPRYRTKLTANLALAGFVGLGPAVRAAREAGRMVGELPFIWLRPSQAVASRVRCDDTLVLDEVERGGCGILFLTPHLGAFEVTARWYALRAPVTVMFRPPRKPALGALLAHARGGQGLRPVPAALSGVRAMLRALRAGAAVGLLPDQVPGAGEGRWVKFFGVPAYTMTLPIRLAQATGAAVVVAVGERIAGGWRVRFERFEGEPTPEAVNARMEQMIRAMPHQYLWGYNRYKQPEGAPAAPGLPP